MFTLNEALKIAGLPLKEEYDPQKTAKEASILIKALKDQFHVSVDDTTNKDGSVTITLNNGSLASDSESSNASVLTPKNLSKAIDGPFRAFRQKGWYFSQPTKGSFTIGVA